jgi:hypothetical protein
LGPKIYRIRLKNFFRLQQDLMRGTIISKLVDLLSLTLYQWPSREHVHGKAFFAVSTPFCQDEERFAVPNTDLYERTGDSVSRLMDDGGAEQIGI